MSFKFLPWLRAERSSGTDSLALTVGSTAVPVRLQRLGPGDVKQLADSLELERDPHPQSTSFPPACLAGVCFPEPAFPWLLTPHEADAAGLLTPWLALVVIDEGEAARALAQRPGALPALTLRASQLPTFDELPAFAHVQIQGPFAAETDALELVRAQPARACSRLLAAQRLAPGQRYLACLVPTFEAGRRAGLGEEVTDPLSSTPAWGTGNGAVTLPVYVSWRFETSAEADIETLVRRLAATPPPTLPPAPALDLSPLGVEVPTNYRGVLQPVGTSPGPAPEAAAARLQALLAHTTGGARPGDSALPRVGLPWLGDAVGAGPGTGWAEALNLDPRLRTLAGLGAEIVRQRQDKLVDAFWRQAGAMRRAQRLFVGATFAATVATRLVRKHLAGAGAERLVQALRPQAAAVNRPPTIFARMTTHTDPQTAAGADAPIAPMPALRRVAAGRRLRPRAASGVSLLLHSGPALAPRPAADPLFSIVTLAAAPGSEPPVHDVPVPRPPLINVTALAHAALTTVVADLRARARLPARVDLGDFAPGAEGLPGGAVPRGGTALEDALVPALTELDAKLVFPAIDAVPDDGVLALAIDGAAVEALLVGANHELVRELQWRGAPVRPDATLLANAWESLAHPPIADWAGTAALGAHAQYLGATVIVLRSAVVARLPELDPWLVQALAVGTGRRPGTRTLAPTFRGRLGEEIVYFGFALTPDAIAGRDGSTGWYLCFQQGLRRPRFGLDETRVEPMQRWSDLDWSRAAVADGRLHLDPAPSPRDPAGLRWGRDGAHMAAILIQKPVRFAIHGSQLPGLGAR